MCREGILFVLSGPSGAGKGTVLQEVLTRLDNIAVSVSVTTRAPRAGEIDGLHYHFRTHNEFAQMIENGEFLEYVTKFKNRYGTPKSQVEQLLASGKDVILEIETNGATQVRKVFPRAVLIFVTPTNPDELGKRLDKRGSETAESKALRLKIAQRELKCIKYYSYIAINDDLAECTNTTEAIIRAERCRLSRNPELKDKYVNYLKNKQPKE
ncbi:MAG: guanylate kinase [Clostridia bacterium]